jgi:hypothetical protein
MQDTELFVHMAEIAGVFVGFGALIAVRSGGTSEPGEVTGIRWVVSSAIWVVIAALAPIIVSRYGVTGHELWLVCSLFALVFFAVMVTVQARAPENLEEVAATLAATPRVEALAIYVPTIWLPMAALVLALAIVVLGLIPEQEQALYFTAVGIGLFMGAIGLLAMVFWRRRPVTGSDPTAPPARGGPRA